MSTSVKKGMSYKVHYFDKSGDSWVVKILFTVRKGEKLRDRMNECLYPPFYDGPGRMFAKTPVLMRRGRVRGVRYVVFHQFGGMDF